MRKDSEEFIFNKVNLLSNYGKLKSCGRHVFKGTETPLLFECENCAGIVNAYAKDWYEKGLKDGRESNGE